MLSFRVGFYAAVVLLVYSTLGFASDLVQVNRYQRIEVSQSAPEKDLMAEVLEIEFPKSVNTVGDAITIALQTGGYRLDVYSKDLTHQSILLDLPLPDSYRQLQPQSLKSLIELLAGEAYKPRVNPVHRSVGFVLKEEYMEFVRQAQTDLAKIEAKTNRALKDKTYIEELKISNTPFRKIQYGPIKQGETLTRVSKFLPLSWLTLDQQLVALFRANPQAFIDNNMNHLVIGASIVVPDAEDLDELPPKEATAIVDVHEVRWKTLNRKI